MKRNVSILEKLQNWLPLALVFLLLLGSWWLSLQVQPLPEQDKTLRHEIDYSLENILARTLNNNGEVVHTLQTEKLWHFPDDNTTHLQNPVLLSSFPNRPPLHIVAQRGVLNDNGDEVFLYDHVRLKRTLPDRGLQTLETNYLHVIPDKDWADSDQAVSLKDDKVTANAVGMELDNQTQILNLLSNVKVIYAAPR